jgi:hypothetical protein
MRAAQIQYSKEIHLEINNVKIPEIDNREVHINFKWQYPNDY